MHIVVEGKLPKLFETQRAKKREKGKKKAPILGPVLSIWICVVDIGSEQIDLYNENQILS